MIYGYARISTKSQDIERQIRNLRQAYPDIMIYQEVFSGTTQDRPEWKRLLNRLQTGDTVVFDSVSRMSRTAEEGFEEYRRLYGRGVELVFLREPHINTSTYKVALSGKVSQTGTDVDVILEGVNRYLLILAEKQIKIAFDQAEKEVSDLHTRTKEGLETARKNGKRLGRPTGRTVTEKERRAKNKMRRRAAAFGGDLTDADCMRVIGICKATYYKYKKDLMNEAGQVPGRMRLNDLNREGE